MRRWMSCVLLVAGIMVSGTNTSTAPAATIIHAARLIDGRSGELQTEMSLVIEDGRVVEDDAPEVLVAREGSRYRALREADEAVRQGLWSDPSWRRLRVDRGALSEAPRRGDGGPG